MSVIKLSLFHMSLRLCAGFLMTFSLAAHAAPPVEDLTYLDDIEGKGDYFWKDDEGVSFIETVIQHGQFERALRLIDKDVLSHLDDRHPFSSVFEMALRVGDSVLIKKLIVDAKAKNILTEGDFNYGLANALSNDEQQIVELFLREGASLDVMKERYPALLAEAVYQEHAQVARMLIETGFPLNSFSGTGESVLMMAVWKQNSEMVEYLLDQGVDLTLADGNDLTELGVAL